MASIECYNKLTANVFDKVAISIASSTYNNTFKHLKKLKEYPALLTTSINLRIFTNSTCMRIYHAFTFTCFLPHVLSKRLYECVVYTVNFDLNSRSYTIHIFMCVNVSRKSIKFGSYDDKIVSSDRVTTSSKSMRLCVMWFEIYNLNKNYN